jgi:hypothetical protein
MRMGGNDCAAALVIEPRGRLLRCLSPLLARPGSEDCRPRGLLPRANTPRPVAHATRSVRLPIEWRLEVISVLLDSNTHTAASAGLPLARQIGDQSGQAIVETMRHFVDLRIAKLCK